MRIQLLVAALLLGLTMAGCLSDDGPDADPVVEDAGSTLTPVQERSTLPYDVDGDWSSTLQEGAFEILDPQSIFVPVELPLEFGGAAATGDARVHMGLWLPDVPEGTQVPVVADIGPYYSDGDVPAMEPARRLGGFLIENLVPHGFAVAQVSVFGSGDSNHCMDLMGKSEQLGIDAAVRYLGSQGWSNGNVGLIGRSYDGSTPWEAAMFGNPHLKTIVPISGLIGSHELMWRNGSAEFRGPIMHNGVYGFFGIDTVEGIPFGAFDPLNDIQVNDPDPEDAHTMCRDYLTGPVHGSGAYATGGDNDEAAQYWADRYFLGEALANYNGSIYIIHGLQDWNVDSHMAFPTHHLAEEAGLEVKGLYGQWAHMYPDREAEHSDLPGGRGGEAFPNTVRYDWAQDLLEWFDHYLRDGAKPQLHAEVQDAQGQWRIEETYPPKDADRVEFSLSEMEAVHDGPDVVVPHSETPIVNDPESNERRLEYRFAPFANDTRIAGNVHLHATVTPGGPGGQMFAYLYDVDADQRLGHAIMDLRYHAGGKEMQTVTPGQPIVAKMEFFALDAVLPAGHRLGLILLPNGEDYLPSSVDDPIIVDAAASVLRIPTVERGEDAFFAPPGVEEQQPA